MLESEISVSISYRDFSHQTVPKFKLVQPADNIVVNSNAATQHRNVRCHYFSPLAAASNSLNVPLFMHMSRKIPSFF
jgi:hypothetical protein